MPSINHAHPSSLAPSTECQNIVHYRGSIRPEHREKMLGQTSMVLWFSGLSGSGKSTIAHAVEERLHAMGKMASIFDGDNVRQGLCRDLSFSPEGRAENLRRIAEIFRLFLDGGQSECKVRNRDVPVKSRHLLEEENPGVFNSLKTLDFSIRENDY